MCGRYTLIVSIDELMERYLVGDVPGPFDPRYNIAPMQMVHAVVNDGVSNRVGELRWGLVPTWAKTEKDGYKMINARAETVADKPAYRSAFQRKRCLIPADGFYEWQRRPDGSKQPYRIVLKDERLFSFAGLYESWVRPDGSKLSTCTIITTEPNELMADIHDRMPAILRREDETAWLQRDNDDKDTLQSLLQPYDAGKMRAYKVGAAVGNVRNTSPDLINEVE